MQGSISIGIGEVYAGSFTNQEAEERYCIVCAPDFVACHSSEHDIRGEWDIL
jgi:hypothetical protein